MAPTFCALCWCLRASTCVTLDLLGIVVIGIWGRAALALLRLKEVGDHGYRSLLVPTLQLRVDPGWGVNGLPIPTGETGLRPETGLGFARVRLRFKPKLDRDALRAPRVFQQANSVSSSKVTGSRPG